MTGNNGPNGKNHLGVNLAFTKFLFVIPKRDDDWTRTRLRQAGASIARGFFNDFDTDGYRDEQTQEAIHFLVADDSRLNGTGLSSAPYAAQVSARYRPRLTEVEMDLRRRIGDYAEVIALDGAFRTPRYTSAELYAMAYKSAAARVSGRLMRNVIVLPLSKAHEWWEKSTLDRHAYFYPHTDPTTGGMFMGHARAAEAGIQTIFRRLYHNPDGYDRENEYDFITYFECADEHLATFDRVCQALRDEHQNPEWRYVIEGPEWRGRRVMRW